MDNITHSLIGLAAGEACSTVRKKNRAPIWIASMLANNIPDIDVPIGALISRDPLSHLLMHRGYSHTLLLAPLQGPIVFLLIWALYRKKQDFPLREVLAVSVLGPFLHILADYWNSYGVHPFWPFSNEWYYGDFVFILEPWIWLITIPALFLATKSKALRSSFALVGIGIIILAWINALVPWQVAALLSSFTILFSFLLSRVASAQSRISISCAVLTAMLGIFSFTRMSLAKEYSRPGFELALAPYPGNPFCWTAQSAGFIGSEYHAAVVRLAPFPAIFPVQNCPLFFSAGTSAPLNRVDQPFSRSKLVLGIFTAKREELDKLSHDCRAEAFLRFARIPYWKQVGDHWLMGDLRFDRGGGRNFASVEVPGTGCPDFQAPWVGKFHPEHSH
jgi:inner membrane protein